MGSCMSGDKHARGEQFMNSERDEASHPQLFRPKTVVRDGLHIRKNPETGQLQGMPQQWCQKYNFPFAIDKSKSVPTINLPSEIRPPYQLPQTIQQYISLHTRHSALLQSEREREKQRKIQQAAEYFGCKNLLQSSIISISCASDISELEDMDQQTVGDLLTTYGLGLDRTESRYERELLTTVEFGVKLQQVKFIEAQPAEDYDFQHELGFGGSCRVYQACPRNSSSPLYAVRIMPVLQSRMLQKIREEVAVMLICRSRNIIHYHFSYYFDNTLFMFVEYMRYGSLTRFIRHYRKGIDEGVIAYVIRDVLRGLEAVHRRRQLHRDLKSDNILVNGEGEVKICDFGYGLQLTKEHSTASELAGTPAWMAPELIKKQQYTESVDIWSLGIVLVQLCEGQPRYLKMNPVVAMVMIVTRPPEGVTGRSAQLRSFLGLCLKKDPNQRATIGKLLLDPFIQGIGQGVAERQRFIDMWAAVGVRNGN